MPALPILFLLIVIVIVVVGYFNSDAYKIRKQLKNTPHVAVNALAQGTVAKVIGRVTPIAGRMIAAPLTQRACVLYEVIVEEYVSSGKSGSWRQRIREVNMVDFTLDDGTGVARVPIFPPTQMKFVASKDSEQRSGTFNDASPHLEAFLARHGMKSKGWVFNKSLRYREGVFEPGETVAVCGAIVFEDDPTRGTGADYRGAPRRACLVPPQGGVLVASDEPRSVHG